MKIQSFSFKNYLTFVLFFTCLLTYSQDLTNSQKTHKTIGDVLRIAMPATALASTFIKKDGQKGTWQFVKVLGTTVIATTSLKFITNKTRPDGGKYSFPSGHVSAVFASAAFIQIRYGWKYGIPSYLLAGYVGYTRIQADRHDGWDVVAGAVLGAGMGYLFTKPFGKNNNLQLTTGMVGNTPTVGIIFRIEN